MMRGCIEEEICYIACKMKDQYEREREFSTFLVPLNFFKLIGISYF